MELNAHDKEVVREFAEWLFNKYDVYDSEDDAFTLCGDMKYHTLDEILEEYLGSTVRKFTGFYDNEGKPIYLGDTVYEGCNGLVRKVVVNQESEGGYGLEGCGPSYGIADAGIEWRVVTDEDEVLDD